MLRPFTLRQSPLTNHCVQWASTLLVKTPLWFVSGQSHRSQMPSKCGSLEKLFPPLFSQSCHTQQYLMNAGWGWSLSTSWEKLKTMPECLRYCFNHCSGSEKYFCKESSANAEGTRAHYDLLSCFLHGTFFLWGCCFPSTSRHSPWLNQWPMSPIRINTVLYGNGCSAVSFVESLRRQNANSKPGLGLPWQKIPCITLILQSVITLYWLGM